MTYRERYNELINYRKENPLTKDQHGENHHIMPRSIYPELIKDEENIVRLTASEHYKAHYLLVRLYEEEGNREAYVKMLFAFNQMSRIFNWKNITDEDIEELSKLYGELKVKIVENNKPMLGKHHSEETRRKMSESRRGKQRKPETVRKIAEKNRGQHRSEETRRKISERAKRRTGENNPFYGRHHSEETKRKMSESMKGNQRSLGRKLSEETKRKISEVKRRRNAERKVG